MRYTKLGGIAVFIGAVSLVAAQTLEDQIAVRPISYADLGKLVRNYRGKVIVVDVWSLG